MEKIETYKDKLTDYYKKTKTMAKLIFDCKDIEKISPLYQHYFQLLDKMLFYNQKIVILYSAPSSVREMKTKSSEVYVGEKSSPTRASADAEVYFSEQEPKAGDRVPRKGELYSSIHKDKLKEYNKTHENLENQIKKWKTDAMKKYNLILEWYNERKDLINEKYVTENQIAKLKLLYNEQKYKTEKLVMGVVEEKDQYIIYNINNIIDFLLVINESNNIRAVTSLYRISNIIKNIGIKSLKEKQFDFDEVYNTIKSLEIDESLSKKLDDIMEYIKKRNVISISFENKNIENLDDDKMIKYIKELKIIEEMINNNNKILDGIIVKHNEHTKRSSEIV